MNRTVVGTALVVGLLVLTMGAIGAVVADDAPSETDGDTDAESNESFGATVSSFAQASVAEAESEVDDGMFAAALNRSDEDERRALIEQRQERLEQRQERLAADRASLRDVDPDEATVRDRAVAARVDAGAIGLERSINGTEQAAAAAGLDTETLAELRANASELRGPEVAELARSIAGVGGERGPPVDVPGGGGPGDNDSNATSDRGPPFGTDDGVASDDADEADGDQ